MVRATHWPESLRAARVAFWSHLSHKPLDTVLPTLFSVLVHVDAAGTVTRRWAIRDELIAKSPHQRLIETLIQGRLLQAGEDAGGRGTITVAHEALLTAWPALHEWVEAHRAQLQRFHRLLLSLASDDLLDRRYAVTALSDMVTVMPDAVPALTAALADADGDVRRAEPPPPWERSDRWRQKRCHR